MPSVDASMRSQYERDGFLIVEDLLGSGELALLHQRITDVALGQVPGFPAADVEYEPNCDAAQRSSKVRKINRCAENDAVFMAHAANSKILDVVETLIGTDFKLYGSQCFMKPPGGVEKPYHQDSAYFTIEPAAIVTCWAALDDVSVENGCLWVIPGSHRGELFDHNQPWQVGGRVDMQVPDEMIDRTRETPIAMPAGSCSFHHSMLLHRSGPNQTQSSRRGLAVHYMSSRSRWTHPSKPQPAYPLMRGQEHAGCV